MQKFGTAISRHKISKLSRQKREAMGLKALSFRNYQYIEQYIVLLLNANFNLT